MPEIQPTLTHFTVPGTVAAACAAAHPHEWTYDPGKVTCFACRKTPEFKRAQLAAPPVKLSGVMADTPELEKLRVEANLRGMKNERGMYVIEETIHHGDYRSIRRVEVDHLDQVTVNAVLMSSPYRYGDWLGGNTEVHRRRAMLDALVEDLRHLRENRSIGWSTFKLIKP